MRQLGLFDSQTTNPDPPELDWRRAEAVAKHLPFGVRLGTSSWTFPGWSGIVYPPKTSERELRAHGIGLYTRYPLFRTVGIDRSYYAPMDAATLRHYACQLPAGFLTVQKVPAMLTSVQAPRTGSANPRFLDVAWFMTEVLEPNLREFESHIGALVFQFAPMRLGGARCPAWFCDALDHFFEQVRHDAGRTLPLAVELRNRELLVQDYARVLAKHGVAHVFNFWEAMPPIAQQLALPGLVDAAPPVVCRLLIPPGKHYALRKQALEPFDRIVEPQPAMRRDVVDLAIAAVTAGRAVFVVVNNKAEGCGPLTVLALAEAILAKRQEETDKPASP